MVFGGCPAMFIVLRRTRLKRRHQAETGWLEDEQSTIKKFGKKPK
jgi:hypothetical protein